MPVSQTLIEVSFAPQGGGEGLEGGRETDRLILFMEDKSSIKLIIL